MKHSGNTCVLDQRQWLNPAGWGRLQSEHCFSKLKQCFGWVMFTMADYEFHKGYPDRTLIEYALWAIICCSNWKARRQSYFPDAQECSSQPEKPLAFVPNMQRGSDLIQEERSYGLSLKELLSDFLSLLNTWKKSCRKEWSQNKVQWIKRSFGSIECSYNFYIQKIYCLIWDLSKFNSTHLSAY